MAKELKIGDIIGKGKRGIVRRVDWKGKECAVKIPNPNSDAICRIRNEGQWLKKLNKFGIGPKYYFSDDSLLVMEFIEGVHLSDFLKSCENKKIVARVLKEILNQCKIMDELKVNKLEMHRVTKNVIVSKNKPVLIDFERCKRVLVPKNVTQFFHFLMKLGYCKDKNKVMIELKKYKKNMNNSNFTSLKKLFF